MKRNKVYCGKCTYFQFMKIGVNEKGHETFSSNHPECHNEINEYYINDWYGKGKLTYYRRSPENINRRNKCKWYIEHKIMSEN